MPDRACAIPLLTSIAPVSSDVLAWFVDIWGVMHNGVRPFTGAVDACRKFRARGGVVILLSNAPRPKHAVASQLDRIGVPRAAWDDIVSSGDTARALVAAFRGQSIFHLGPERDLGLYEGLGVTLGAAARADAVVCTGLFDDEIEMPETYGAQLDDLARRNLAMICANPDLSVERGGRIIPCAGAVAAAYEQRGGRVVYAGKPHLPIYETAFETVDRLAGRPVAKSRILAIGDGIRTDIAGAAAAGIGSVFIASGVHVAAGQHLDGALLADLFPHAPGRPIGAMTELVW